MPIAILMPSVSDASSEVSLIRWLTDEGAQVNAGEILAEVQCDKAVFEVVAPSTGVLQRILVPAGQQLVSATSVLGLILGVDEPDLAPLGPETGSAGHVSAQTLPIGESAIEPSNSRAKFENSRLGVANKHVFATPVARKLARESSMDLAGIPGGGPGGRITKQDVLRALDASHFVTRTIPATNAPTENLSGEDRLDEPAFDLQPLSSMRRAIARRLTEAKQQIPHFYLTVDCDVDALLAMRKKLNYQLQGESRVSVSDMLIKAVAMALHLVPAANVSWSDAGIRLYKSIDIALAVALQDGLITPVIRAANQKGLSQISAELKRLIEKARAGKLRPEEFQGGTCSISNLGMYGIKEFDAIVNPPQASILAVGASEQRAVVRDGVLEVATVMTCTLSADHRAIDGAVAARFLTTFKKIVQDPLVMSP
ncbi:MAG TPA: dihydrolipoamide acetyltransferase family protein [Casimicrobiaceae bacterium]|jgi:pyruvate dehydrogenase E2 component (dihydrolipoamide acetyltransferase)|nr:dihydrolipoamide acetyltransferase family protein [Casimicrobiaceae bacterium]